jgi:hypothetical protein
MRTRRPKAINGFVTGILVAALTVQSGCSKAEPGRSSGVLSSAQAAADVDFLRDTIEAAHPNPFFHRSRAAFERSISNIRSTLPGSVDAETLYRMLAPVVADLGDSHTNLVPYTAAYGDFRDNHGRLFPLELRVISRRAYVAADYGPERIVPTGAELTSIQGMSIPTFLGRLGRFVGAERTALRDTFVAGGVRAYMWHAGIVAPFSVDFLGADGKLHYARLAGATIEAIHAWDNSNAGYNASTPYRLTYASADTVALLTIHSFDDPDGWVEFTRVLVATLRRHKSTSLLIDVRNNSGGDTGASDALLALFARREFRDFSEADTKISEVTKRSYGKDRYSDIYGEDAWSAPNGTLLRVSGDWQPRAPFGKGFPGRVFILVGAGTFSTAAIFAAAAQDARAALILGQESGGLPTLYGELFDFSLPASALEATVSTKYFVRPNGDRSPKGVLPDHRLVESPPDEPTDPELEAAIAYARGAPSQ